MFLSLTVSTFSNSIILRNIISLLFRDFCGNLPVIEEKFGGNIFLRASCGKIIRITDYLFVTLYIEIYKNTPIILSFLFPFLNFLSPAEKVSTLSLKAMKYLLDIITYSI